MRLTDNNDKITTAGYVLLLVCIAIDIFTIGACCLSFFVTLIHEL